MRVHKNFEFQSVRRLSFVRKIHIILILKLHLIGFVYIFIRTTRLSHLFFSIFPLTRAQALSPIPPFYHFIDCFLVLTVHLPTVRAIGRTDKQFCLDKSLCVLSKHFFPNHSVGWKTCACAIRASLCVCGCAFANKFSFVWHFAARSIDYSTLPKHYR